MANSENTAINDLIARVTGASSGTGPTADSPPPPGPMQQPRSMHTTYPASMPVAAPFEPQRPALPTPDLAALRAVAPAPRAMAADLAPPAPAPLPPAPLPPTPLPLTPAAPHVPGPSAKGSRPRPPSVEQVGDPAAAQSWRPSMASQDWSDTEAGEHMVGTQQLRKPSELRRVVARLVLPIALLVVAGVVIGGIVAFHGNAPVPAVIDRGASAAPSAPEPAPPSPTAAPSAPEPAPPSPIAALSAPSAQAAAPEPGPSPEAVTPSPQGTVPSAEPAKPPELVEVRIDSAPSGATVTLVDRGKSQFVGTTPVNAAVDPSRDYDLVFSWASRPSQQEHLDPRTTRRISATLGKRAAPRADGARAGRTEGGEGALMISSKPPCEIVIDGKPTGLTTPQRAIALPAGSHKVTLINRENDLRKTISVQITASATEKVIEDLMK